MNALQFAADMESEGIEYYEEQIRNYGGTILERIFTILADDEGRHLALIHQFIEDNEMDLPDHVSLIHEKNIFTNLEKFEDEIRANPPQVAVYEMALTMEEKAVQLYRELLDTSAEEKERAALSYLLKEEKKHIDILEELITRIRRVDEWVESAEFGNREEY